MHRSILILATALVTGCAETPIDDGARGAGGKADGELTTLTFDHGWRELADGPLVAGRSIRVSYDLSRLTACRGTTNGSDVWGVSGHVSFDGRPELAFAVSRLDAGHTVPVEAELAIPAGARVMAMWFTQSNRWGCNAYDSNMGADYRWALEQRANTVVFAFEADWTEGVSDTVHAGDQLVIHYAPERLAECAASTMGNAAWAVTAHYQIDGGPTKSLVVTRGSGPDLVAADPELTVPRGSDLAIWFEATSRWGCHAYDSDFGSNYHTAIGD